MLPLALGGLRVLRAAVPCHYALGSMEKIILSCGQGMHPTRKTLELYYLRVEVVKSREVRNFSAP